MAVKRSRQDSTLGLPVGADAVAREAKFIELDSASDSNGKAGSITCHLPPHTTQTFPSMSAYEAHIAAAHSNRCKDCAHNFPSPHFLDLHITENHDPFFASKRERNARTTDGQIADKIYACLVEDCEKRCSDWKKRRSHLIDKHGFPRNYDFFIVNTGIDGRMSMLRPGVDAQGHRASSRERSGTEHLASAADLPLAREHVCSGGAIDSAVDSITNALQNSSLQPGVPLKVSFGKRSGKSGFARS